ncbi:sensor histidine kinase [Roseateles sp.]|uniref:sensor histidine kinase n=1 Tax=Roseateles sp. TaxID=1971397 RepID=UPI00326563A7
MDVLKVIKRNPLIFPMTCVAVVALIFVSEVSYWQSARTLDRLGAMAIVPTSLQELQWGILDAEAARKIEASADTAESRQAQLLAYGRAMQAIAGAFTALDAYYVDQAKPKALLAELHRLAEAKLAASTTDPRQMHAIRELGAQLLQFEASNVLDGRGSLYDTLSMGRIGVATLSAIGLLTLFIALRQRAALESQRREQQRLVQAAHDLLEIEVVQRTAELTQLTYHLQTAREDERARLARDLHDEMGALMTSAKLDSARIRARLAALPTPAPEAMERLSHLIATLNKGIALKRRIVEDLQPSALTLLGLVATLEIMGREFADSSGLQVLCKLEPVQLSASANLVIYRLMQEAMTNISKYAQASHVWLGLGLREGHVEATVRDDGMGFDMRLPIRSAHGLVGMRFRVEAEGGTMNILAAPGLGTLITARLPQVVPPAAGAVTAVAPAIGADASKCNDLSALDSTQLHPAAGLVKAR